MPTWETLSDITYRTVTARIVPYHFVVDRKAEAIPRLHHFLRRGDHTVVVRGRDSAIDIRQVRHRGRFAPGWIVSVEFIPHAANYAGQQIAIEGNRFDYTFATR